MERRHPHIFGDAEHGGHHLWEKIKAEERAGNPDKSALAGVALALPALERAAKLQRRAARTGFDWPDAPGRAPRSTRNWPNSTPKPTITRKLEELGDLLFAVVNLARHLNIEPEAALREANRKFEKRFRAIETGTGFRGPVAGRKGSALGRSQEALRPTPTPETAPNCRATSRTDSSHLIIDRSSGRALRRVHAARRSGSPSLADNADLVNLLAAPQAFGHPLAQARRALPR